MVLPPSCPFKFFTFSNNKTFGFIFNSSIAFKIEPPVPKGSDSSINSIVIFLPIILSCGMSDLGEVYDALSAVGWYDDYPVALLLCINQLNEINNHEINKFWELNGKFKSNDNILLDCQSIKINDEKVINDILNNLTKKTNKFDIKYEKNNINDYPSPPYTTTTLQQDAYNILKLASKKTMELAQKLYE